MSYIAEARANGGEFDLSNAFETVTESEFSDLYPSLTPAERAEKLHENYSLIIIGTDYSAELSERDASDLTEVDDALTLKAYVEKNYPIIFTNDAISYVNSQNYVTPVEKTYEWNYMTLAEGESDKDKLASSTDYRQVKVYREEWAQMLTTNTTLQNQESGYSGTGTYYLGGITSADAVNWQSETLPANTYYAVLRPIPYDTNDGRYMDSQETTLGYMGVTYTFADKISLKDVNGKTYDICIGDLGKALSYPDKTFVKEGSKVLLGELYSFRKGCITKEELKQWYEKEDESKRTTTGSYRQSGLLSWKNLTFAFADVHTNSSLCSETRISEHSIVENSEFTEFGTTYYEFTADNGRKYLATKKTEPEVKQYTYVWQKKTQVSGGTQKDYTLGTVAGDVHAVYADKNHWNYLLTQYLRNAIGMDRFSVTTALENEKKRDPGSTRRWAKENGKGKTEIQGFTNAALLEFAYAKEPGASHARSLYADSHANIGSKPRTGYIKALNYGVIGSYPFAVDTVVNERIEIKESHAPYYQLDLERDLGKNKVDDVTVWYTLEAPDETAVQDSTVINKAAYFKVTTGDAGNNYYLYSKGKTYYTGFSMYQDSDNDNTESSPREAEMKLFVNTIYAALNSEAGVRRYYDTVVKPDGVVSEYGNLADNVGTPNRYVCYYETEDELTAIRFRVQKANAAEGETVPLAVRLMSSRTETGIPVFAETSDVKITSDNMTMEAFPVISTALQPGQSGSYGSSDAVSTVWTASLDLSEYGNIDGKTLIIAPVESLNAASPDTSSIWAELIFVQRTLFDLD
jgi:hypothetical protein